MNRTTIFLATAMLMIGATTMAALPASAAICVGVCEPGCQAVAWVGHCGPDCDQAVGIGTCTNETLAG